MLISGVMVIWYIIIMDYGLLMGYGSLFILLLRFFKALLGISALCLICTPIVQQPSFMRSLIFLIQDKGSKSGM